MRRFLVAAALTVTIWLPLVYVVLWLDDQTWKYFGLFVASVGLTWFLFWLFNELEAVGDDSLIASWLADWKKRRQQRCED